MSASASSLDQALSTVATALRSRLGESLASVQKFDVPVEATTPSLEALKAYSMAVTTSRTKGDAEAIPFMKREGNIHNRVRRQEFKRRVLHGQSVIVASTTFS